MEMDFSGDFLRDDFEHPKQVVLKILIQFWRILIVFRVMGRDLGDLEKRIFWGVFGLFFLLSLFLISYFVDFFDLFDTLEPNQIHHDDQHGKASMVGGFGGFFYFFFRFFFIFLFFKIPKKTNNRIFCERAY
jgi:hypothetical protein